MNKRSKALIIAIGLTGFAFAQCKALASAEFSDSFSKSRPSELNEPFLIDSPHMPPDFPWNTALERFFEPDNLSKNAKLTYRIVVEPTTNDCTYKLENRSSASTRHDIFYCEQTLWEATPVLTIIGTGSRTSKLYTFDRHAKKSEQNNSIKRTFTENHPELKSKIGSLVIVRVIPSWAAGFFPNAVSSKELDSIQNLKAIPISKTHSDNFHNFQIEWMNFLKAHSADKSGESVTREILFAEANRLNDKYSSLFV